MTSLFLRAGGEAVENEKIIFMDKGALALDLKQDNATSILCQAMMDETVRLRSCIWKKERDSIRKFLIESFQLIYSNIQEI